MRAVVSTHLLSTLKSTGYSVKMALTIIEFTIEMIDKYTVSLRKRLYRSRYMYPSLLVWGTQYSMSSVLIKPYNIGTKIDKVLVLAYMR